MNNSLLTLDQLIDDTVSKYGQLTFIVHNDRTLSYQDFFDLVNVWAHRFLQDGIKYGQLIGLPAPKKEAINNLIYWWALWKIGAITVLVNPELAFESIGQDNHFDHYLTKTRLNKLAMQRQTSELLMPLQKPTTLNTAANGVFTSGSSGPPKLVMISGISQLLSAQAVNQEIALASEHRVLLALPLYHIGGMALVMRTLLAGACLVCQSKIDLEALEPLNITHASMVPTQLFRLLKKQPLPKSLNTILLGGSSVSNSLLAAIPSLPFDVFLSFGMTETVSAISLVNLKKVGHPLYFSKTINACEFKLKNQQLWVKSERLCLGYLRNNKLQPLETIDGWFCSEDRVKAYLDGFIWQGRQGNQFISGGENVQAEAVEAFLMAQGNLAQAVVVAVDDAEFGQRGFAFVSDLNDSGAALTQLCQALAPHLRPARFEALPKQKTLKPNRKALAQLAHTLYQQHKSH